MNNISVDVVQFLHDIIHTAFQYVVSNAVKQINQITRMNCAEK